MKTKKNLVPWQKAQGDVLFERIEPLDEGIERKDIPRVGGRIVFAEGEATGHAHTTVNRLAKYFETERYGTALDIPEDAGDVAVEHQEHRTVTMEPGHSYRVIKQVVYRPQKIVPVAD